MAAPSVDIAYRTTISVPRTGPVGRLLGWLGTHPLLGGLLSGLAVVAIAGLLRSDGVRADPLSAAILSAIVIATWTVLFFLMRQFFEAQSQAYIKVLRQIQIDEDGARWLQQKKVERAIDDPRLSLTSQPVPADLVADSGDSSPTAWPVWIVIESEQDQTQRLVFETRDSAARAADYDAVTDAIIDATDERLPRAIAAPLLQAGGGPGEDRNSDDLS